MNDSIGTQTTKGEQRLEVGEQFEVMQYNDFLDDKKDQSDWKVSHKNEEINCKWNKSTDVVANSPLKKCFRADFSMKSHELYSYGQCWIRRRQ